MNDLTKTPTPEEQVFNAHEFLQAFLNKFETAKRGGIHDFMEIALFNMVNSAIKDIDFYLMSEICKLIFTVETTCTLKEQCEEIDAFAAWLKNHALKNAVRS